MIKTINIKVSAANPQAPLGPFYVLSGSAVSLTILDIPRQFGDRVIESVTVRAKNADFAEIGVAAIQHGSAWGVTIPGDHFETCGTISNGITIQASGKGDDGDAATWILGTGQVVVVDDRGVIYPEESRFEMDWYNSVPANPKKGAVAKVNGVVSIYTSHGWKALAGDAGDVKHEDFADVETIGETFTEDEMREKVNTVINILKGTSAVVVAAFWFVTASAGVEVMTAAKGTIPNTAQIVTNVTYTSDIPGNYAAVSNAAFYASNRVETVKADVSSAATAATNYTDAAVGGLVGTNHSGDVAISGNFRVQGNVDNAWQGVISNDAVFAHVEGSVTTAAAVGAHAEGMATMALGDFSHSEGFYTVASGLYSHADGSFAHADHDGSYAWSGPVESPYHSHGDSTYSINPSGGLRGFWIGETNMAEHIANITNALPAWTKRATKPTYTASEVGAASSADLNLVGQQVNAIGSYLNAEDARFVSTNYDSVVRTPEAYVEVRLDDHGTNRWVEIWREMTRWNKFTGSGFIWDGWGGFYNAWTNIIHEVDYKADRAWGAYDSETGGYSPEGFTQISSSNILICSGMAYQRVVSTGGAVWVLQCNSGVAQIGGDTNGYFRVLDSDGNVQFEIVKGDRREMGCDASGITVGSGTPPVVTIPYSVVADEHPTISCCANLAAPDWKDETDADCIATVTWSGSSGAYVATVQRKVAGPSLFVKARYVAGAETYIRNAAPVSMDSIILNGVKYYLGTATIDGHTVLTLSTTAP